MITVRDKVRRLASQHRGTGTERLLSQLLGIVEDNLADPGFALHTQRTTAASGIWLDLIGIRMGLPRSTTLFPDIDYFGFARGRNVGFGQGPFFTDRRALQTRLGISDPPYRRMLRARALALVLPPTRENLQKVLDVLFDEGNSFIVSSDIVSTTVASAITATCVRNERMIGITASGARFNIVPGNGGLTALPDALDGSGWTSLVEADDVTYGLRAGQVFSLRWTSRDSSVTRVGTATLTSHSLARLGTQTYGFTDTHLYSVDLTTPSESLQYQVTGITGAIVGASADASKLYCVTAPGNVYSVAPSTGVATLEFALSTLVSPSPTAVASMEVFQRAFVFYDGVRASVVDDFVRVADAGVTIWATSSIQDFVDAINLKRDALIPRPAGVPLRLVEY